MLVNTSTPNLDLGWNPAIVALFSLNADVGFWPCGSAVGGGSD